jgi:cyclophilin family peptidyl-prolyl cis-trans isomerase
MKPLALLVFLVAVVAAGCDAESGVVKEQKQLYKAAADKVAKADSLAAVKEVMTDFSRKKIALTKKLQAGGRDRALESRLQLDADEGQAQLGAALAEFADRHKGTDNPTVVMETSMGSVKIELFEKLAPITVKNFLFYVDEKFYDGTIFHRMIPNFMIQGGGFLPGMKKEKTTGSPIENESYNGLVNDRGTLAMARTSDPNSATAQFFINVKDNTFLNRLENQDGFGYAVFGKVTEGMDVVDKIKQVPTGMRGGHENVPTNDVIIQSIRRVKEKV